MLYNRAEEIATDTLFDPGNKGMMIVPADTGGGKIVQGSIAWSGDAVPGMTLADGTPSNILWVEAGGQPKIINQKMYKSGTIHSGCKVYQLF